MAYEGFKALVAKGVPPGVAANQGRKKYGAKKFNSAAAQGKSLRNAKPVGTGGLQSAAKRKLGNMKKAEEAMDKESAGKIKSAAERRLEGKLKKARIPDES